MRAESKNLSVHDVFQRMALSARGQLAAAGTVKEEPGEEMIMEVYKISMEFCRGLHGHGIYFTVDACKAHQFCDDGAEGCMILARVVLGHPFFATGPIRQGGTP